MDFSSQLQCLILQIESGIDQYVPSAETKPARVHKAMRYSLESGGKRLRPVLLLAAKQIFCPTGGNPLPAAIAVECVHTYSLIHDDLPCMDDDNLRRGRPTAHRAFDEATALLAGDALLTHAFLLLSSAYADVPDLCAALVRDLATAAGSEQLIGGQMEDLLAEERQNATADELEFIHLKKTAAIISAALVMGGRCGGIAEGHYLDVLRKLGMHLGMAFQIVDDILDVTASTMALGKTAGKDAKAGKTTFVKLYGLDGARDQAKIHTDAALSQLTHIPEDTIFLRRLIETMLYRDH